MIDLPNPAIYEKCHAKWGTIYLRMKMDMQTKDMMMTCVSLLLFNTENTLKFRETSTFP